MARKHEFRCFRGINYWMIDLARDRQSNCRSCGAPIYWIKTAAGRNMPLSEALSFRSDDMPENHVWLASHFADCPNAQAWRKKKANG